jgi:lipoprotein-anchoring transpeptidase ErfK/SrfK
MRFVLLLSAVSAVLAGPASASVTARVSNGQQTMRVYVDDRLAFTWPVSTARRGYWTPPGAYRVQRMERMWRSRKYAMAPMPFSLFFHGGYAIHGTTATSQLGRPASHGCVRLATGNARTLFGLVQRHGGASVVVTN